MLRRRPAREPEITIVGGLTIDRFANGTTAGGGSVLHASRGMALDGRSVATVTMAGPEPEARAAVRELASLGRVDAAPAGRTIAFGHDQLHPLRTLRLLVAGEVLLRPATAAATPAVLFAPIADELGPGLAGQPQGTAVTGALLQGWLRQLEPGEPVRGRRLAELPPQLVERLAAFDLLVASTEDVCADASNPPAQLAALRQTFGLRPHLLLTAADEGAWLAAPGATTVRIRPPRIVDGVPTVGAGDVMGAATLAAMSRGAPAADAARDAAGLVAAFLADRSGRRIHVVGDVHGMRPRLVELLRASGLVDATEAWSGGRDELWLSGDLTDRGPDGIGVIDLVMRLQDEAATAGGQVGSVLGNHELLLLAARAMPDAPAGGPAGTFRGDWLANGGRPDELERLDQRRAAWLAERPALARVGRALLLHADAASYVRLGRTVAEANRRVRRTLARPDPQAWDRLLADFTERRQLMHDEAAAVELLSRFGGAQVVHGHTPIHLLGARGARASRPYVYCAGRCVDVDGGLGAGGRGFVYTLPSA
jgi:hypothetical protein